LQGLIRQLEEPVSQIERRRLGILGVDEQRMDTYVLNDHPGSTNCVHQQQLTQTLPLVCFGYRQPPKPNARNPSR